MIEQTLSAYDELRIQRIVDQCPLDNVAAMAELERVLLEKNAAIAAVERRLEFAKGQLSMMEKKNAELEAKLKNDH